MNIDKFVNTFEALAYNVFDENDFSKKNAIEKKIESLVDNAYKQGVEQILYNELFNSPNLLARIEIANISAERNYDLYRSLKVLEDIKNNADALIFFDDYEKNKKWQDYFSKLSNAQLKGKITFYENLNDDFLFKKYYDCIALYGLYYDSYVMSKKATMQKIKETVVSLLNCVQKEGKLSRFFDVLFEKAKEKNNLLEYVLTEYFLWITEQKADIVIADLSNVIRKRSDELNPKMLTFINGMIDEIADNR